jgi:cell division septum initiation protein DivIVA
MSETINYVKIIQENIELKRENEKLKAALDYYTSISIKEEE